MKTGTVVSLILALILGATPALAKAKITGDEAFKLGTEAYIYVGNRR
jgi:hypothetical protein